MTGVQRFEVTSGRARLAGERAGAAGPTVVLLHAGVADRRGWASVVPALSQSAIVVSYDRRGYGETQYEAEPHGHVDDLLAVVRDQTDGPVWFLGSSQGGRIAIDLTLREPQHVAGLVLVAPAVSGGEPEDEDLTEAEARLDALIEAAEEADDLDAVNRYEAHLWLDGPAQPEGRVGGEARTLFLDMNGFALAVPDPGDTREPPSALERLGELSVPTLVAWGDLDLEQVKRRSAQVAREVPGAESHVFESTAHMPYLERPGEVAERVIAFMAAHSA